MRWLLSGLKMHYCKYHHQNVLLHQLLDKTNFLWSKLSPWAMWIMGVEKLKLKTLSSFVYTECFRLCRKAYFAIAVYLNCSVPSRPVWRAANAVWVKPAPPPTVACVTVIIVTDNTQEKVPNKLYMRELCIPQNSWNNHYRMGSFILNKILFISNFAFALWKDCRFPLTLLGQIQTSLYSQKFTWSLAW